jgi:hypothetical protein
VEVLGGRLSYPVEVAGGDGGNDLPSTLASEGDGRVAHNVEWELKVCLALWAPFTFQGAGRASLTMDWV